MAEQLSHPSSPVSPQAAQIFLNDLVELVTSDNLETALHKGLVTVIRQLGAEAGSLLYQGQTLHQTRSGPFRPEALTRIERWEAAIGKRLADTTWSIPADTPIPISTSELANSRLTLINIPLVQETVAVGTMSFVLPPGNELTEDQREFLLHAARSLGELISFVVDIDVARQSVKQMEVFDQVGQALVTTFDINKLLSDTMQLAVNLIDAGAASIMLIDKDRGELVFEASHGSRAQELRQQRIPIDEGIAGWVVHNVKPVIANDARTDPRFSPRVDVRTGFLTQSIAAVPLKIKGHVIGVLEVLNKYADGGFTQQDIRLMNAVAVQSAIAIENARLYQKVSQERDYIIKAQEDVRRELARNLHDGPVQLLSAIDMSLDHLERLNKLKPEAVHNEIVALRNLVHQATRDARNLLFEMRPVILETQGLVPTFEQYVAQLRDARDYTLHFENLDAPINYDKQIAGTIFSIIQEAVNNIKRHARARNVWLLLEIKDKCFVVTVRDDGIGFDVNLKLDSPERAGHFGLLNMRERSELIEAELTIQSQTEMPERGTTVSLSVPLPAAASPLDRLKNN